MPEDEGQAGTEVEGTALADALPDDLKGSANLEKFKTVGDLAKGYTESERHIGDARKGYVKLPDADSPDKEKELNAVYTSLGKPASAKEYTIQRPQMPEDMPYDDSMENEFKEVAFKSSLTNNQVQELSDWFSKRQMDELEGTEEDGKAVITALKQEWGTDFDAKMEAVKKGVNDFVGDDDEVLAFLDRSRIGNNPRWIKGFAKYGEMLGEGKFEAGDTITGMSQSDAQNKINEMLNDPKGAYQDRNHPGHRQAQEDFLTYHEVIHGNQPAKRFTI